MLIVSQTYVHNAIVTRPAWVVNILKVIQDSKSHERLFSILETTQANHNVAGAALSFLKTKKLPFDL